MTNQDFAQGLRELAALYERHPELITPNTSLYLYLPWDTSAKRLRASLKAFADGGIVTKRAPSDDLDTYFRFQRTFTGGLTVELNIERSVVCRRVRKMQMVETWECPEAILEEPQPE